jgi:hypothetical protein
MASTQPAACMGMETSGRIVAEWDAASGVLKIIETPDH